MVENSDNSSASDARIIYAVLYINKGLLKIEKSTIGSRLRGFLEGKIQYINLVQLLTSSSNMMG